MLLDVAVAHRPCVARSRDGVGALFYQFADCRKFLLWDVVHDVLHATVEAVERRACIRIGLRLDSLFHLVEGGTLAVELGDGQFRRPVLTVFRRHLGADRLDVLNTGGALHHAVEARRCGLFFPRAQHCAFRRGVHAGTIGDDVVALLHQIVVLIGRRAQTVAERGKRRVCLIVAVRRANAELVLRRTGRQIVALIGHARAELLPRFVVVNIVRLFVHPSVVRFKRALAVAFTACAHFVAYLQLLRREVCLRHTVRDVLLALALLVLEHPCGGIVQRPRGCAKGLGLLATECRCTGALAPERSADTA